MKNFELSDSLGLIDRGRPFEKHIIPAIISGIAGIAGSVIGGFMSNKNTDKTVDAALQNTRETNDMNYRIAHENNDTAIQLQREMNDWNLQQWNRNNEYNENYNSTSAQLQRWMDAGLNPNGFNGSNGSVNMATPVQQLSTPNLTTPTMQSGADSIMQGGQLQNQTIWNTMQGITGAFEQAARTAQIGQEIKESKAREQNQLTDAKVRDYLAPSMAHLNWKTASEKEQHIQLMKEQANSLIAGVEEIQQHIKESKAKISLMSEEQAKLAFENIGAPERWKILENTLANELRMNRLQVRYFIDSYNLRLGNLAIQNDYLESQKNLTESEKKQVDFMQRIIEAQNPEDALRVYSETAAQIVKNEALSSDEKVEQLQWLNGTWNHINESIKSIGIGVGAALNGASSVRGSKGKVPRVKAKRSRSVTNKDKFGSQTDWFEEYDYE